MRDRYLNLRELAHYANRSTRSLRELVRQGELRAFRPAPRGRILVRASWYDTYVDHRLKTPLCSSNSALAEQWLRTITEGTA